MNNLSAKSDHELVLLYEQGNDKAFDILLSRYQSQVYSYILFIVHDENEADDFFQETFTRAVVAIRSHRYQTSGLFGAWLIRIAHNLILDSVRMQSTRPLTFTGETSPEVCNSIQFAQDTHEDELIRQQNTDTLNTLLDYLPEAQREVIYLHYFEGRSFKEIAQITGVSINTSLGRMRYALINLRKLIRHHQLSLVG